MIPGIKNVFLNGKQDHVAIEEPLEIRVQFGLLNNRSRFVFSTTMRTPGHDRELAIGYCFVEGVIESSNDLLECISHREHEIQLLLHPDLPFTPSDFQRTGFTSSACGVCGKHAIATLCDRVVPLIDSIRVPRDLIQRLPNIMQPHQVLFQLTGGIHAAAAFSIDGQFLSLFEDVGRHNALDKLIGHHLITRQPMNARMIVVSGRASFELVQKAAVARVPILIAVGAPSSLAIELADRMGITLIGFTRMTSCNVYTHADRILS